MNADNDPFAASTEHDQQSPERTFPPRWLIVVGILSIAVGLVMVGLIRDSSSLAWVGVGVGVGGLCIALGAEVTSINLGFVELRFPGGKVATPDGRTTAIQNITVIQRRSDKRVFFEASKLFQDYVGGRSIADLNPIEVASAARRSVGAVPPEPAADWILSPGTEVPHSGIYDVVDEHGRYLNYQRAVTTSDRKPHAAFPELDDPRAAGYVLRKAPIHAHEVQAMIFRPGQEVPWDGIYDVVDEHGAFRGLQKVCVKRMHFTPLHSPGAGYLLRDRVVEQSDAS